MELRERLSPRADLLPSSFVYALQRHGHTCWLAVSQGTIAKVGLAPRNEKARRSWQQRFILWQQTQPLTLDTREGSELAILNAWFRRHPTELSYVVDFDSAMKMCS